MDRIKKFLKDESATTAIEYAFIATLVSIALIGGATIIGTSLNGTFTGVSGNF